MQWRVEGSVVELMIGLMIRLMIGLMVLVYLRLLHYSLSRGGENQCDTHQQHVCSCSTSCLCLSVKLAQKLGDLRRAAILSLNVELIEKCSIKHVLNLVAVHRRC